MSDTEFYNTIKTLCLEKLAAITAAPEPGYAIAGILVTFENYCRSLRDSVNWCEKKLREGDTPFEVVSGAV
jgi:hypothetical protein